MKTCLQILALLFLALPSCVVSEAPYREIPEGEVGHPGTGILFPRGLGGFGRGELTEYDGLRDISVGYNRRALFGPAKATIYVYPGMMMVSLTPESEEKVEDRRLRFAQAAFAEARGELERAHPEAQFLHLDNEAVFPLFGKYRKGFSAAYGYEEKFGFTETPCFSQVTVFALEDWLIKIRITYPVQNAGNVTEAVGKMMMEFARANGGEGVPVPETR